MIQSVMLVALGFLIAGFVTLLFASAFWKRAIRLTTERIHNSMPVTLAEIEADKDQLRADFAIRIRQLEAELEKSERQIAKQKIEISRKEIELVQLRNEIEQTGRNLEEQKNANRIYEQTIITRLPKMEAQLAKAKELLGDRYQEINKLRTTINQQESKIGQAAAKEQLKQAELDRLKAARVSESESKGENSIDTVPAKEFELLKKQNEHLENRLSILLKRINQKASSRETYEGNKEEHLETIERSLLEHAACPADSRRKKKTDLDQATSAVDKAVITIDNLIAKEGRIDNHAFKVDDGENTVTREKIAENSVDEMNASPVKPDTKGKLEIKQLKSTDVKTRRRSIRETLADRLKSLQGSS